MYALAKSTWDSLDCNLGSKCSLTSLNNAFRIYFNESGRSAPKGLLEKALPFPDGDLKVQFGWLIHVMMEYMEKEKMMYAEDCLPVEWETVLKQLSSNSLVSSDIFHVASMAFDVKIIVLDFDKKILLTFNAESDATLVIHHTRVNPENPKSVEHYVGCSQLDIDWE
jgi:hypothetical protein